MRVQLSPENELKIIPDQDGSYTYVWVKIDGGWVKLTVGGSKLTVGDVCEIKKWTT